MSQDQVLYALFIIAWFFFGYRGYVRYRKTVPEFYNNRHPFELAFMILLYSSFGPFIYVMSLVFSALYTRVNKPESDKGQDEAPSSE